MFIYVATPDRLNAIRCNRPIKMMAHIITIRKMAPPDTDRIKRSVEHKARPISGTILSSFTYLRHISSIFAARSRRNKRPAVPGPSPGGTGPGARDGGRWS